MRLTPGFDIRGVKILKALRIAFLPGSLLNLFALFLAFRRPAAFLSFSNPPIRLKKSPAQDTLLSLEQFKLSHERSLIER